MRFRTGADAANTSKPFEVLHLPLQQKRQICVDLLEEFGARVVEEKGNELRFHCNLPFGNHAHGDTTGKARLNYEKMTFNCFSGETLVRVLDEGAVSLKELARRGEAVLLDGDGRWVRCPINTFPSQRLWRVTVRRNKVVREFYATANHRWLRKARGLRADGSRLALVEATTDALRSGDRLPSVWKRRVPAWSPSPVGVARGFVYGDGTSGLSSAVALFCCPKDEPLLPFFSAFGEPKRYGQVLKISRGIPKSWKTQFPALDDGSAYLYGWLAGYFAADGSVTKTGQPVLSSADRGALEFVQVLCDRLGIRYYDIQEQTRLGLGRAPSPLFQISFDPSSFTEEFFILPHHRDRWASRSRSFARHGWIVVSVEETERIEEVYCPEVPTTGSFVLDGNLCTKNCWVCGGGGFLWWVSTMQGGNDVAARAWLAERTGLGGVQETQALLDFLDSIMGQREAVDVAVQQMPHYDERILDQWSFIHPYLTEFRHIPAQNVIDSRVGYGTIRINMGDGLFVPSERITIPHFWKGRLVGWQSRRLSDDGTPKYVSTPMMPKDLTLYNYDPKAALTVVVEAPISVVSKRHLAHLEATFGASVTDHQLSLLEQHQGDIALWMDNDPAGWNSMEQMCAHLSQRTSRLFIVDSPYAADPADLSDEDFAEILSTRRVHWSLWRRPTSLLEYRRDDHGHQEVRDGAGAAG